MTSTNLKLIYGCTNFSAFAQSFKNVRNIIIYFKRGVISTLSAT